MSVRMDWLMNLFKYHKREVRVFGFGQHETEPRNSYQMLDYPLCAPHRALSCIAPTTAPTTQTVIESKKIPTKMGTPLWSGREDKKMSV